VQAAESVHTSRGSTTTQSAPWQQRVQLEYRGATPRRDVLPELATNILLMITCAPRVAKYSSKAPASDSTAMSTTSRTSLSGPQGAWTANAKDVRVQRFAQRPKMRSVKSAGVHHPSPHFHQASEGGAHFGLGRPSDAHTSGRS
jgi:hypothetical protein